MTQLNFTYNDASIGRVHICFEAHGLPMRGHLLEGRMPEPRERFNASYIQGDKTTWSIPNIAAIITTNPQLESCGVGLYGIDLYNTEPVGQS